MSKENISWFSSWFDSPYYHLLYRSRDDTEAEYFLNNVYSKLQLPFRAKVLDLACGKGRHSKYLNYLGYDVLGIDLASQSIEEAKKSENEFLHFKQADMRYLEFDACFDAIVNLFTSFGYFEDSTDNEKTLLNVHKGLKKEGVFVMDYLNPEYIMSTLVKEESKEVEGILFDIKKFVEGDFLIKKINVFDQEKEISFQERVRLINSEQFEDLFAKVGLKMVNIYGNYALDVFNISNSPRQIFILKK